MDTDEEVEAAFAPTLATFPWKDRVYKSAIGSSVRALFRPMNLKGDHFTGCLRNLGRYTAVGGYPLRTPPLPTDVATETLAENYTSLAKRGHIEPEVETYLALVVLQPVGDCTTQEDLSKIGNLLCAAFRINLPDQCAAFYKDGILCVLVRSSWIRDWTHAATQDGHLSTHIAHQLNSRPVEDLPPVSPETVMDALVNVLEYASDEP
jgi:hypothetical protein